MVAKEYDWKNGAPLAEHTKRKLKILREYFFQYINVRCQIPQQERFRLVVVDGFCGGGRYKCGTAGSPIIFIEELKRALETINVNRAAQGMKLIEIECLLIFNDGSSEAIEQVKAWSASLLADISENVPRLHIQALFLNKPFDSAYPEIKARIQEGRYKSVLFNLDQCGTTHVELVTLIDIMRLSNSAEIFYTFMIQSLLAFLSKEDPVLLQSQLKPFGVDGSDLSDVEGHISNSEWLGGAERLVFEAFKSVSRFASPFSINNPDGWRYWLIHFANNYRARQVYNNILHDNASSQAHFGRSGLDMLSYDPSHEGALYLFDMSGRVSAKNQLHSDIPRLIRDLGDASRVSDFYEMIYNATPAHAEDIHAAIFDNKDLQVLTPTGSERRKASTIGVDDTIKLKPQTSFFPIFFNKS